MPGTPTESKYNLLRKPDRQKSFNGYSPGCKRISRKKELQELENREEDDRETNSLFDQPQEYGARGSRLRGY